MLTLMQGITLDNLSEVYSPIVRESPLSVIYFAIFMLTMSIALMNMVTALMVGATSRQADQEQSIQNCVDSIEKKKQLVRLKNILEEIDTDGSGYVDISELQNAPPAVFDRLCYLTTCADITEALKLFSTLDTKGLGVLAIDDFCTGLLKLQEGKPVELSCIMKQCLEIQKRLERIEKQLDKMVPLPCGECLLAVRAQCSSAGTVSHGQCSSGGTLSFAEETKYTNLSLQELLPTLAHTDGPVRL